MTEVDTSSYPTKHPEPLNPLELIGKYANANQALMQNQLTQQQLRGKIALGKLIDKNTDEYGNLKQNALMTDVARDPDARIYALQTRSESNAANPLINYMGQDGQGNFVRKQAPYSQVLNMINPPQRSSPSQDKIDRLHSHIGTVQETLQGLADKGNEVTQKDVINSVADMVAHPDTDFHATDGAAILSQIPSGPGGTPPTGQQLQAAIQPKLAQVNQAKSQLEAQYPSSKMLAASKVAQQFAGAPSAVAGSAGQEAPPSSIGQENGEVPTSQGSVGIPTDLPVGYSENIAHWQQHYNQVQREADAVPQTKATLERIMGLSKKNLPTGTFVKNVYQALAERDLAPKGVEDQASMLQEITKYMQQAVLSSGMPDSDKKLNAVEEANTHPDQLPQTIQHLIPSLEAMNEARLLKANYYRKIAGVNNGNTPALVSQAQSSWNNTADIRAIEYSLLPAKERKEYVNRLTDEDAVNLLERSKRMKQEGLVP